MTKKIFRAIFIVATAMLGACTVLILGVLYGYFSEYQKSMLVSETRLAAQGVEKSGADYFTGLLSPDCRFTWIAKDGTVLYDTKLDAETMGNHADREEVTEALETGMGESVRRSSTLGENMMYRAIRLRDGTVLRASTTQYTAFMLMMGVMQPVILLLAAAVAASAFLARRVSSKLVRPLNTLDLEHPLENDAYGELAPLFTKLEHQKRQIKGQMEELERKKGEFAAVTEGMGEGLVLLGADGRVLIMNPAAMKLFGMDESCVGQDMLVVDRSLAMQKLIKRAMGGERGEALMELAAGKYQVDASPVTADGETAGVCLLAFDVTEKTLAERQRREFSANVSHELKTPLQTIMGSAELIENGLVKPEDMPVFVGRIRSETARMVTLIDDIIRLSQLDEGGDMPRERADVLEIAREAARALSAKAGERNVTLTVTGENVWLSTVRRLTYEIIYNLCDNAIKYNVPGGSVSVTVLKDGENAVLTVEDTGIGIPRDAQNRVFERFYRVDKSHSRETGGTGLGLSIVKHAAQYLGAAIALESEPGKGTSVTVSFPDEAQEQ